MLVDKRHHIRGMFDGTDTEAMRDLLTDLKMLLLEEKARARQEDKPSGR